MPLGSACPVVNILVRASETLTGITAQVYKLEVAVLVQSTDPSIEGNRLCVLIFHVRP
jgi:hypothetical protein